MSGHSKWATIKHQKAAKDKSKAKVFAKVIRQIEVAAREGGGDMESNATLRTMYTKARNASVPNDTIERAIKRGTGDLEGVRYEQMNYEGYAPCGVAMYVEALSDNRNRTGSEVRATFAKYGGAMAEPGSVAWQFDRKGQLLIPKTVSEDELMLAAADAGAEDFEDGGDQWVVTTDPSALMSVRDSLESSGLTVSSFELTMVAAQTVPLTETDDVTKVLKLVDALEDNDDVQNVYANFDIDDKLLEALDA